MTHFYKERCVNGCDMQIALASEPLHLMEQAPIAGPIGLSPAKRGRNARGRRSQKHESPGRSFAKVHSGCAFFPVSLRSDKILQRYGIELHDIGSIHNYHTIYPVTRSKLQRKNL